MKKEIGNFTIEKNIPMPKVSVYPLKEMEIGDSFFIPETFRKYERATSLISNFGRRNGMKFSLRKLKENGVPGCRVWRVE